MLSVPVSVSNPTLATVQRVQKVMQDAEGPITRYELHKRLDAAVNYPVLDAVLHYFDALGLIADEGKGGKVLWIHSEHPRMRALLKASRRSSPAMTARLRIDQEKLAAFCRRWRVRELALFGSVLREDFGPESDVDALVTFRPDAEWSLLDHARMEEEFKALVGRSVDLVTRRAVERSENWVRRDAILASAELVYVEG
jgi:hypothetical protein